MPPVSSGTGLMRGTFSRKMFWSSRIWIDVIAESLVLWITAVSRPVIVDVGGSSRAWMV